MKAFDPLHCSLSGTTLVEASAGTGKTHNICTLFVRLIAEQGLDVRDLLVVTFTEAATAELRGRIRARLLAELDALTRNDATPSELSRHLSQARADLVATYVQRLRSALEGFDQAAIFTIHGFCHRLLRENAFECEVDFEAELVHDETPLYEEVLADFWARETYALDPFLLRMLEPHREPRALAKVMREVSPRPWANVLPVSAEKPDLELLTRFRESFETLRATWPRDRESVREILLDDPGLDRRRYRVTSVEKKLLEIDRYLASGLPLDPLGEEHYLRKLTTTALSEGTRPKFTPPAHPFFEACSRWASDADALRGAVDAYVLYLRRGLAEVVRSQVPRKKERLGLQFFDDLLTSVDRALQSERGEALASQIRARYPAALIDEFQDTDLVQYRIFRTIYGGTKHPSFLIGDPKQAIYAFRGADIFAYLSAVQDAPNPPETLEVNWRSDPPLVRAIEQLFRRAHPPFLLESIELPPVRARPGAHASLTQDGAPVPPLQLRFLGSGGRAGRRGRVTSTGARGDLTALVAADITRLLTGPLRIAGEPIRPSDVAVLVRSNWEAELLEQELGRLGVPSVSSHAGSVLESEEARELALVLTAIVEPSRADALRAALGTRLMGASATEIFELGGEDAAWDVWVARFHGWHRIWQEHGFTQMHREFMSLRREPGGPALSTRLLAQVGGERALTNHLHLAELLHGAAHVSHLGMLGLMRWFERARIEPRIHGEMAELRLETDGPAVKLVTIHKSKGLEYPVVYCPSLWFSADWKPKSPRYDEPVLAYHDPKDAHRLNLELRDDEAARLLSQRERRAEALRLSYVALTRAKHLCIVVTGDFEALSSSALGYLLHHRPSTSDPWAETHEHLESLDEGARWAETLAVAAASDGCISASRLDESEPPPAPTFGAATLEVGAKVRARALGPSRVISSYSALVRGSLDRELDLRSALDRGETEVEILGSAVSAVDRGALSALVPLRDFPRTATAGSCFHAILEELDFSTLELEAIIELTRTKLGVFGFDARVWTEPVAKALRAVLDTPLESQGGALRLAELTRARRMDELPFLISVPGGARAKPGGGVRAAELADVFRRHAGEVVRADYPDRLERLEFPALRGFLKGYIDLVFEHERRFYVVDYKSNFLGPNFSDYGREQMSVAMSEGHYFLQYHLYVLAVHRYLAARKRDYDYERDFGGVYYLFIKGMSPSTGPKTGVFFDRPSPAIVDALDTCLGDPSVGRRAS